MLKEAKRFAEDGLFEGIISLRALFESREAGTSDRKIEKVLIDRDRSRKYPRELSFLRAKAAVHGFELEIAEPGQIDAIATGSTHGGLAAVCGTRTFTPPRNLPPDGFFMLLDGIEDPYNLGYAARSLYAAGCDGMVLPERNWMSAAGVVCRASAGASELMPAFVCPPPGAAAAFKAAGYAIVCADAAADASVFDAKLTRPLLLVVGGEKRGISRALLDLADQTVRLEYGRSFPAALSAASAASVLAFEVLRQNRGAR